MTTRILPPEEYARLAETEGAEAWPLLTDAARVVVVEYEGRIVGCHLLQPVLHAECLWIHPDYRKRASVGRRLWRAVRETVRTHFRVEWFMTAAVSDEVRALLAHVDAVPLPDHFMVPIGDR